MPPFETQYLERGHSIYFSCRRPDVKRMRLDVMSKMRGVEAFPQLWARRTSATIAGMGDLEIISLPDLVAAKKTQRDKDWPMVRRLVEANYFAFRDDPTPERIRFWLMELRTSGLLIEAARLHETEASEFAMRRPCLASAISGDEAGVENGLRAEESAEREADREYWAPLRAELERLRHAARLKESLD